jgi:hypothetical protein
MLMQRNDRARKLADPHDKRLSRFLRIAIEDFDVTRHRQQRDDAMRAIVSAAVIAFDP